MWGVVHVECQKRKQDSRSRVPDRVVVDGKSLLLLMDLGPNAFFSNHYRQSRQNGVIADRKPEAERGGVSLEVKSR